MSLDYQVVVDEMDRILIRSMGTFDEDEGWNASRDVKVLTLVWQ